MVGWELYPRHWRGRMIGMQRGRRSPILPVLHFLPGLSFGGCRPAQVGVIAVRRRVAVARRPDPRVPARGPGGCGSYLSIPNCLRQVISCVHTSGRQQWLNFRPPVLRHHAASESEGAKSRHWSRREAGDRTKLPTCHKLEAPRGCRTGTKISQGTKIPWGGPVTCRKRRGLTRVGRASTSAGWSGTTERGQTSQRARLASIAGPPGCCLRTDGGGPPRAWGARLLRGGHRRSADVSTVLIADQRGAGGGSPAAAAAAARAARARRRLRTRLGHEVLA
jgi:hypothetical protein